MRKWLTDWQRTIVLVAVAVIAIGIIASWIAHRINVGGHEPHVGGSERRELGNVSLSAKAPDDLVLVQVMALT